MSVGPVCPKDSSLLSIVSLVLQVPKATAVQKQALLRSPGASPQRHQQTPTRHVSNATDNIFNDRASAMHETPVSTAASLDRKVSEPDVSTTTSPIVRPAQGEAAGGPPKVSFVCLYCVICLTDHVCVSCGGGSPSGTDAAHAASLAEHAM